MDKKCKETAKFEEKMDGWFITIKERIAENNQMIIELSGRLFGQEIKEEKDLDTSTAEFGGTAGRWLVELGEINYALIEGTRILKGIRKEFK